MSKDSTHTHADKRIGQFAAKGTGYLSFLYLAAQPLLFSTDLLYKLWLNFSTYAPENDQPCRSYLVVSDLILSGICRPVGVNLFSLDDDIREHLRNQLDADNRREVANFVYEYAEHNKTRLSKNIYDVHRIWAMGVFDPVVMENEIKKKLRGKGTGYEKANYLSLYFNSMPLDKEGKKKASITLEVAGSKYEENVLNVRLPVNLVNRIRRRKKGYIPHQLTTNLSTNQPTDMLWRGDDLEDIKERLFNEQQVLINGEGGVGKTALAQAYVDKYAREYKHIAWINCFSENFTNDVIRTTGLLENLQIDSNDKDASTLYAEVMQGLRNLTNSPCLFIIDDAKSQLQKHLDTLPQPPIWHILATSRERIGGFQIIIEESKSRRDLRVIPNLNGNLRESSGLERSITIDVQQPVGLLSSSHGKIESLLVTIPVPYLEERQVPYTSYINIIREFAIQFPDKQLVLLAETRRQNPDQYEQASIDLLKSSLQGIDLHIITTPKNTKLSFSPWAQDAFLVGTISETSAPGIIVHPSEYQRGNRNNDGSIAKEVANRHLADYTSCTFPAPIEAGNVLVAEDFILVGQDEILRSGYSESQFMQLFSDFFGVKKKIITVRCKPKPFAPILEDGLERHQPRTLNKGDSIVVKTLQHSIFQWRGKAQPIFHVDLFMTLLGHNLAGEQIILVGEPVAGFDDRLLNSKEQQILDEQIKDATDRINECIKNLKADLNQYNIPHKIFRNPLPLTHYTYHPLTSWYWASYNNCFVEITDEEKNVWLPRYYSNEDFENPHWKELRRFDEMNKKIFRQNGFNTYLFNHDFHALAVNNGSLLSMAKCLKRKNIQRYPKLYNMSDFVIKLIEINNTYEMRTPEGDIPITNTEGAVNQGCLLKVANGKLIVKNLILDSPSLSIRILLEGIDEVGIQVINGTYLACITVSNDFRELLALNDRKINYEIERVWVSFHIDRVNQGGREVDYFVVGLSSG